MTIEIRPDEKDLDKRGISVLKWNGLNRAEFSISSTVFKVYRENSYMSPRALIHSEIKVNTFVWRQRTFNTHPLNTLGRNLSTTMGWEIRMWYFLPPVDFVSWRVSRQKIFSFPFWKQTVWTRSYKSSPMMRTKQKAKVWSKWVDGEPTTTKSHAWQVTLYCANNRIQQVAKHDKLSYWYTFGLVQGLIF